MEITLSQFLMIFYKYNSRGLDRNKYPEYMLYLFMNECPEAEPFADLSPNSFNLLFSGHDRLSAKRAEAILDEWNTNQFVDMFCRLDVDIQDKIQHEFEDCGVVFYRAEVGDQLAEVMKVILEQLAGRSEHAIANPLDSLGRPLRKATLSDVRYDQRRHKIVFFDSEEIDVPEFEFPSEITPEEMALGYFVCLLAAYADRKHLETISLEQVKGDPYLLEDLNDQREYFYKAQYFRRIVQTIVDNPEEEFEELEEEIYQGIKEIYRDRFHRDGLDRLQKVETAVMNANLSSADLSRFTKIFRSSEKKGMCHVLVEDKFITTWVLDHEQENI